MHEYIMLILPISNTTFSEQIHKYLDLKSHISNTHVRFPLIKRIPYYLCIGVYIRQLPCMSCFPDTCICLGPIKYLIIFIIIKVGEMITSMFKDMMTIYISKGVVCHLQYQVRYFLCVVQCLEVIGPLHRHMITGPVTIHRV